MRMQKWAQFSIIFKNKKEGERTTPYSFSNNLKQYSTECIVSPIKYLLMPHTYI